MRRLLVLALAALAAAPASATAQQRLDPEAVASACTGTPIRGAFSTAEFEGLREVAACALKRARRTRSRTLRTTEDAQLKQASLAGLRLAIGLDGGKTAANRERVTGRVLERFRCSGRKAARVLVLDSTETGGARNPLDVTQNVLRNAGLTGVAPLLGRRTKIAVVALPGRVYAASKTGAVAVAVVGATCTT